MRVVKSLAHVVYVMKNGRIVETGSNPELFEKQKQPYTHALMKAAFDF